MYARFGSCVEGEEGRCRVYVGFGSCVEVWVEWKAVVSSKSEGMAGFFVRRGQGH